MWSGWVTRIVLAMLRSTRLTVESRQILTAALLDKLGALPLRARIQVDESLQILVDGKTPSFERAKQLGMGSKAMLNNFARRFVRETVLFMAIKKGVHENSSPEQGLFAKAALWFAQEEDELYRKLAEVELGENE